MFGLFKKKKSYPISEPDWIDPPDEAVTTAKAKQIYQYFMKEIGFHSDPESLSNAVSLFAEDIKGDEMGLKGEVDDLKADIKELRSQLAELKKKLAAFVKEDSDDVDLVECEIEEINDELLVYVEELPEAETKYLNFKKDKRAYVVTYINTEIHDPVNHPYSNSKH